ncbi:hypothetical protein [Nocardia gipuzkoensis]|nr:hypothetical protein [Nocardia gipuzkoensis]MDE1673683.1 hypothetical protein [Nocardia gipuzkoensis]
MTSTRPSGFQSRAAATGGDPDTDHSTRRLGYQLPGEAAVTALV